MSQVLDCRAGDQFRRGEKVSARGVIAGEDE